MFFLEKFARKVGADHRADRGNDGAALRLRLAGNIRELQNVIERRRSLARPLLVIDKGACRE